LLSLFFLLGIAHGQDLMGKKSYEGVLTMRVQNFERIQFVLYSVRSERVRVEAADREDNDLILLIDYMKKKRDVILPGREQYVELSYAGERLDTRQKNEETNVQKTEETEEIEGFACDKFIAKSEGSDFEVWATKDLGTAGTFVTTVSSQSIETAPWQAEILGMGYFPMRVIQRDSSGDELARVEITGAQRKALSETLFRVPANYEKIDREALQPKQTPKKRRAR
jgi:hypothetical protein